MNIYMYIEGVPGESTDPAHTNWIECARISHFVEAPARPRGKLNHYPVIVFKETDEASVPLNQHICEGTVIPRVVIDLERTSGLNRHFYHIVYSNVTFSLSWYAADEELADEQLGFEYEKMFWTYTATDGSPGPTLYADRDHHRAGYVTNDIDADAAPDLFDPDDDNDGQSDWSEAVAGSDPADPDSRFQITFFQQSPTNGLLEFTSVSNRTYRIYGAAEPGGAYSFHKQIDTPGEGLTRIPVSITPGRRFFKVHARDVE